MKHLKKKIAAIVTVICLALTCALFAACGENDGKYVLTVLLPDGTPAVGIQVAFCDPVTGVCNLPVYTNEKGEAVFEGDEENYHVEVITAPAGYTNEGYAPEDSFFTADWNGNSCTIYLTPATE